MSLGKLRLYGLADTTIFGKSYLSSLDGEDDDTLSMAPCLVVLNVRVNNVLTIYRNLQGKEDTFNIIKWSKKN